MDKFIAVIAVLSLISILWKIFGKDDPATPAEKPANEPSSQELDAPADGEAAPTTSIPPMTPGQRRAWERKVQHDARQGLYN